MMEYKARVASRECKAICEEVICDGEVATGKEDSDVAERGRSGFTHAETPAVATMFNGVA
jgi:hypothetical protein